jgi:hypothetical protein
LRKVPRTDEGRNYSVGREEIKTESDCKEENKPKKVE